MYLTSNLRLKNLPITGSIGCNKLMQTAKLFVIKAQNRKNITKNCIVGVDFAERAALSNLLSFKYLDRNVIHPELIDVDTSTSMNQKSIVLRVLSVRSADHRWMICNSAKNGHSRP